MAKPIRQTAVVIAAEVDDMGDALSHKSHIIYKSNVCAKFLAGSVASPIMLIFMDNQTGKYLLLSINSSIRKGSYLVGGYM